VGKPTSHQYLNSPEPHEQIKKTPIIMHTHKKVDSTAHAIFLILICNDETVLQ
jgi:hypothetical protein